MIITRTRVDQPIAPHAPLEQRWPAVMQANYATPQVTLAAGHGVTVVDTEGRSYLDLIAGIATSSLGHAHPAIIEAVSRQVATLAHTSNLYAHQPGLDLAERLQQLVATATGGADSRVFFANDGTEANEAALKLARKHGRRLDPGGTRLEVVAAEGGFHGRTMGSLAITGTPAKRAPFEPLPGPVRFVPYGDATALRAAVTEQTAAVVLEPTLGEGGVVPPPAGYLEAAREACDRTGALLVLDEVQAGIGRTGRWFGFERDAITPDVITLAKGLGGGLPIGACLALGPAIGLFQPGDHGSTFGGNPVSAAAALAVLDTLAEPGFLGTVSRTGERFAASLRAVAHPLLAGVRGEGLWLALVLTSPRAAGLEAAARAAGFLTNAVGPDALRLAPPLIINDAELQTFTAVLPELLEQVSP